VQVRQRTRTRTFRLDLETIQKLDKAAKRAHTTESNFLVNLLRERLTIDPIFPAFQEILFATETFQSILAATNIDALEVLATETAQRHVPLIIELYESNAEHFDFWVLVADILGAHRHWFSVEGDIHAIHHGVTLRHGFGRKWSRFLGAYLQSAYNILADDKLSIKVGEQFVRIEVKTYGRSGVESTNGVRELTA
jgi:hypothetical protein